MIYTPKESLIEDLEQYGESEVASQIMNLSKEDYDRLGEIAARHAYTGMLIAKALALAAVEIVEGKERKLKRGRRVFKNRSDTSVG